MNAEVKAISRMRCHAAGLEKINHPIAARGAAVGNRLADSYEKFFGSIDSLSKGCETPRKSFDDIDARLDRLEAGGGYLNADGRLH